MKQIFVLTTVVALSACGTLPKGTYTYYQAKSATTLSITQTIACTNDRKHLLVANSVTAPVTAYAANYGQKASLNLDVIDSQWADTDVSVTLSDDGRLKGLNATETGQGEAILKSAISLGTAVAGAMLMMAHEPTDDSDQCKDLEDWVGKDKPATLTYIKTLDLFDTPKSEYLVSPPVNPTIVAGANIESSFLRYDAVLPFTPGTADTSVNDALLYDKLKKKLPPLTVSTHWVFFNHAAKFKPADSKDVAELTLQDTASVHLDFKSGGTTWIGGSAVIIPVEGSTYPLAVPKAKAFGSRKMVLTLSDAGAVNSLEYSKGSGAAGVMNVATAAVTAATPAAPSGP